MSRKGNVMEEESPELEMDFETSPSGEPWDLVFEQRIGLLNELREDMDGEGWLFLVPYEGIGDAFFAAAFLNSYMAKNGIKDYRLCTVGRLNDTMGDLFDLRNVMEISQEEMDELVSLGTFLGFDRIKLMMLHSSPPDFPPGISDRLRNYNNYHYLDMFTYGVFGPDIERESPKFEECKEEVAKFFKKNSLKPGKTVVIFPFVFTPSPLPFWFWIEFCANIIWRGYTVCTYCIGDEAPISGTTALKVPYSKMKAYLEHAGGFVTSRNGICDVVASVNCDKVIVYSPYLFWGGGRNLDYFSLKKMGLTDDVVELEYTGVEFLALMDDVISNIERLQYKRLLEESK